MKLLPHSGQYMCFAKNEWGTATSNSVFVRAAILNNFKVKFYCHFKSPQSQLNYTNQCNALILTTVKNLQEQPPITKTVEEGKPFKLPCEAPDGWPKPNIYWMIQVMMMRRRRTEDDVVYVCFDGTEVHS